MKLGGWGGRQVTARGMAPYQKGLAVAGANRMWKIFIPPVTWHTDYVTENLLRHEIFEYNFWLVSRILTGDFPVTIWWINPIIFLTGIHVAETAPY
jgi:hypothetical protein